MVFPNSPHVLHPIGVAHLEADYSGRENSGPGISKPGFSHWSATVISTNRCLLMCDKSKWAGSAVTTWQLEAELCLSCPLLTTCWISRQLFTNWRFLHLRCRCQAFLCKIRWSDTTGPPSPTWILSGGAERQTGGSWFSTHLILSLPTSLVYMTCQAFAVSLWPLD